MKRVKIEKDPVNIKLEEIIPAEIQEENDYSESESDFDFIEGHKLSFDDEDEQIIDFYVRWKNFD